MSDLSENEVYERFMSDPSDNEVYEWYEWWQFAQFEWHVRNVIDLWGLNFYEWMIYHD
jgi:hypothetical protein